MRILKARMAALALVSGLCLAGCADDMYGPGYGGWGYGPSSSVSFGIGYGGGYGGYGYGYGNPYWGGYGYGSPFGWYDDFYYPGVGVYVYDNYRRPRIWNDRERWYWMQREGSWRDRDGDRDDNWRRTHNWATTNNRTVQPNWSRFNQRPADRPR